MPRHQHGDGSTYQRKRDWRWVGSFDHGTNDHGSRRRVSVTSAGCEGGCRPKCPHRGQIERKLAKRYREVKETGTADANPRTTVRTWAAEWLTIQERRLRPNAYTATRSAVTKWIIPTVGHKRFDTLVPADVRAVANAQRKAGRAPSTLVRTHSVLMGLLHAALLEGYPVTDRVLATEGPPGGSSDRVSIPVPDAVAMLGQATNIPHGSRWVAAFLQGMRQGECLGLEWDRVDFEHREIELSWQLQPLPYNVPRDRSSGFRVPDGYEARQLEGRLHLVRPKSKAGWRVIPMVDWMHTSLEAWREVAPDSPHGLVWPMLNGAPTPSKADDEEFYALQQAAEVHHAAGRFYTPHECRHTTVTLLVEAGVDRSVITAIVGQAKLLESYVHLRRSPLVREGLQQVAARLALPS